MALQITLNQFQLNHSILRHLWVHSSLRPQKLIDYIIHMASVPEYDAGSPEYAKDPEKYHLKCLSVVQDAIEKSR